MSQWKGPVVSDSTSKGVCRSFNRRPSDCTVKAACLRNHGYRGRKSLSCSWKRTRSTKAAKGKVNHKGKVGGGWEGPSVLLLLLHPRNEWRRVCHCLSCGSPLYVGQPLVIR